MSYVDDSDTYEEEIDDMPEDIDSEFETVEDYDPLETSLMMGAHFQQLVNIYESSSSAFPPLRRIPYQESTYSGKFYVVDSGYAHILGFMTQYRGERYHLPEWLGSNQLSGNARELFNRRHATVRNVIESSFCLLKGKFLMIKGLMPNYKVHSQTDIVIACCVLHNFIRMHEPLGNMPPEFSNPKYVQRHDPTDRTFPFMSSNNSNVGAGEHCVLHDTIAQALWANRR
ncbi:Unknown protein [Striga hermonthica]|uniref:DDE Tnp4 domain-containing protein n=1 Tax=Striga hermonthica TaxID=68872 RepID=A0A9N7RHC8_STRHE|nr:Unknown protein [Striga hermonthica]